MKLRVTVEVVHDDHTVETVGQHWHDIPELMPLHRAAQFVFAEAMEELKKDVEERLYD